MRQYPKLKTPIRWILLLILTSGCDEQATQIAREAADRQAKQNLAMADLQKQVAGGTKLLVASDAEARNQIVAVHRQLQEERLRLDTGWSALELERRQYAAQRRMVSLVAPSIRVFGEVTLVGILLGYCRYVLVSANRADTEQQLSELLLGEVLRDDPSLPAQSKHLPALLHRSG